MLARRHKLFLEKSDSASVTLTVFLIAVFSLFNKKYTRLNSAKITIRKKWYFYFQSTIIIHINVKNGQCNMLKIVNINGILKKAKSSIIIQNYLKHFTGLKKSCRVKI